LLERAEAFVLGRLTAGLPAYGWFTIPRMAGRLSLIYFFSKKEMNIKIKIHYLPKINYYII